MPGSDDTKRIKGIAHDIRQMLMVISGRVGLLLERDPDPETRRHLLAMEMAASDAGVMLARLSDRRENDGTSGPTGVRRAVEEACSLILPPDGHPWLEEGRGAWSARIEIPAELAVNLPGQILREVLGNLLTNALAAMPEGGRVHLSTQADARVVHLRVRDSGPGVPVHLRERIFRPGFSTSGDAGRGLGLGGCRALLEDCGGGLFLAADRGTGATFELEMPRAPGEAPVRTHQPQPRTDTAARPGEILVVDDEPAVREMLDDLLRELDWQPLAVGDADEALSVFRPGRFALALIDRKLPGRSGLELASRLRQEDPRMVLVLVSGWDKEDIASVARDSHFDFTAEKPLTVDTIREIIGQAATLLGHRGTERDEF